MTTREPIAVFLMPATKERTSSRAGASVVMVPSIFLPKEHGSWSLALEPLALGMLLAPSLAGGAFLLAAVAGFFSRRPARISFSGEAVVNWRESREALVVLSTLAVAGGFEAMVLSDEKGFWPLLIAAPLGLLFAWFDSRGESRAAAAELCGSAAFGFLPAVFATLAGLPPQVALTFALLALVRSIPTVLAIRDYLRWRKGRRSNSVMAVLAATAGGLITFGLILSHQVPWGTGAGALLLMVRAAWLLGPWRPQWSASRIGMMESILGGIYVAIIATAFRFT